MIRRPPRSTRTDTLCPYTTLFRSGVARRVKVHLGEPPLVWLRSRGMLTDRQFLAGGALRRDWELAGLGPRVTMRWDEAPSSGYSRGAPGAPDPAITQLSARQRFDGAIEEAGAGLADILWRVVCAGDRKSTRLNSSH